MISLKKLNKYNISRITNNKTLLLKTFMRMIFSDFDGRRASNFYDQTFRRKKCLPEIPYSIMYYFKSCFQRECL